NTSLQGHTPGSSVGSPRLLLYFYAPFFSCRAEISLRVDPYCLKTTRKLLRQFSPNPTRKTSMSGDKYRNTISLEGWNRNPGATRNNNGSLGCNGTSGKYPYLRKSF